MPQRQRFKAEAIWEQAGSLFSRRYAALPKKLAVGLLELLREIGDENAYARHLASHGTIHSPTEWRKFSDERFRAKYQRAKCC
jgi:hypothetical protein